MEPLDVLAFGPHPDDVEFGCGGYVIKAVKEGKRVGIIDLTQGEMGTNGTPEERQKEAQEAARIMGVTVRENLMLPNGRLYNSPEVQKTIITAIRTHRPGTILIPYDYDRHPDHENASRLVREAVFTTGLVKYRTGDLPPHRPTHFLYYSLWIEFDPSFILNITDEYDTKIRALMAHESQFTAREGSIATVDTGDEVKKFWEARARHCGFMAGVTFGEPYRSVYFPIALDKTDAMLPNLF